MVVGLCNSGGGQPCKGRDGGGEGMFTCKFSLIT